VTPGLRLHVEDAGVSILSQDVCQTEVTHENAMQIIYRYDAAGNRTAKEQLILDRSNS
jgi:hypothetical protein